MSRTALVIGATGQIGMSAMETLRDDGWTCLAGARTEKHLPEGVTWVRMDRSDDESLRQALGSGVDVVIDCVAFDEKDAQNLLRYRDHFGSAIVISTLAVYLDDQGRNMDANDADHPFPKFDRPLRESDPTVEPGPSIYATRKIALENAWLDSDVPVTLLRPGPITGVYSGHPRELWFVQRALDGRRRVPLAYMGQSRFHPTSVCNLSELIRLAASNPGTRVLNTGDPHVPTVEDIGRAIYEYMNCPYEPVPLPGEREDRVGSTPWSIPAPYIADLSQAQQLLGYEPVAEYADAVGSTVEWIVKSVADRNPKEVFPAFFKFNGDDVFDYAKEDAVINP